MLYKRVPFLMLFGGLALVFSAIIFLLMPAQPVEAQCGSQASSCKNCHEVQGELPVNDDGTGWHESHAFGDFCYICHAGNQQATNLEEAHAGMVPPLSDTKAACQMCHASDLDERAQVYASVLVVDLESSPVDSSDAAPASESSDDNFWGSEPEAAATDKPVESDAPDGTVAQQDAAVCPPIGQELVVDDASFVNYAERYKEIVLGERPVNWGNVALGGMIGLLVLGGGGFVLLNEVRVHTSAQETKKLDGEYPADVVEMLPALTTLNTSTRNALMRILSNPHKAEKVLNLVDNVVASEDTEEPKS